jgi:VIT1/CCC1 family predicted Fe2+/Mn2+ transporter
MRFEHTLPEPTGYRAITCALTIALGYFIGGFIPLLPYIFVAQNDVALGLYWSIGVMAIALFTFGYVKTCFVAGWRGWRNRLRGVKGGIEMVIVGGVAAGAAMGLVIAFDHNAGRSSGAV